MVLVAGAGLVGCARDDPKAALDAAVQRLQDNLKAKKTSAVLERLHSKFRAQDEFDIAWAQQTMTLMFLRHANIRLVAATRSRRVDPVASHKGCTEARVLVTGARGLIPDEAATCSATLEWQLEGADWKLFDLRWKCIAVVPADLPGPRVQAARSCVAWTDMSSNLPLLL